MFAILNSGRIYYYVYSACNTLFMYMCVVCSESRKIFGTPSGPKTFVEDFSSKNFLTKKQYYAVDL